MAKIASMLLGIAVAGLLITAVFLTHAANEAKADARAAAEKAGGGSVSNHVGPSTSAGGSTLTRSFANVTADNPSELAAKHRPYPAELPPVPPGDVVEVHLTLKDVTIEIAPGVKYAAWGFEGGVPGPTIHVREGQKVKITLTNGGGLPHSIDFHAARIAPDRAFRDVDLGESITYTFTAGDPGVYMYHCGTKPVLAHIANGMYGAIVVDPEKPLATADKEYVLVASEWYLNSSGVEKPAQYDMNKAHAMVPDWVTWNGCSSQYATHPLRADPGDLIRFYVVAAGPSLDTDFHVVGTILDRAYVNADMDSWQENVQTVGIPAGGGAVFEVEIDDPSLYPFLSHSFASVDLGQVGLLQVGKPKGTASH
jgi:nitrite reductase (NO-forming)